MALQFAMVAMGSALRGTGIVKPTMVVQVLTLVINTILAPILIAGWGIGRPMGVAGAGLASTIAIVVGVTRCPSTSCGSRNMRPSTRSNGSRASPCGNDALRGLTGRR